MDTKEIPKAISSGDWLIILDSFNGKIFEKKDGSVIVTATWNRDISGFQFEVHFKPLMP